MTKFVFLELSLYVILTRLFFGSYIASTKIVCDIIDLSNAELDEIDSVMTIIVIIDIVTILVRI